MSWLQAFLRITIANFLVLIPMLLNSHAGTKYGIPFPVFARLLRGARRQLSGAAARVRRLRLVRHPDLDRRPGDLHDHRAAGRVRLHARVWIRRAALDHVAVVRRVLAGPDGAHLARDRRTATVENWAAPLVTVAFTALLIYMLAKAGGIGPIPHQSGTLGWGSKFWPVFWPSLMAMIAF
jgi:NCS1 family nucleobase:cation symporter-1